MRLTRSEWPCSAVTVTLDTCSARLHIPPRDHGQPLDYLARCLAWAWQREVRDAEDAWLVMRQAATDGPLSSLPFWAVKRSTVAVLWGKESADAQARVRCADQSRSRVRKCAVFSCH